MTGAAEPVVGPTGLRFDPDGLIPAVVQEADTGEVLTVAWMNGEALRETLQTRRTHFWSRSRQTLWRKGDTSGHRQHVTAVYADCDRDTLLVLVHQDGVACHTGSRTCFFAAVDGLAAPTDVAGGAPRGGASAPEWAEAAGILDRLGRVIEDRKAAPLPGSYVAGLLAGG